MQDLKLFLRDHLKDNVLKTHLRGRFVFPHSLFFISNDSFTAFCKPLTELVGASIIGVLLLNRFSSRVESWHHYRLKWAEKRVHYKNQFPLRTMIGTYLSSICLAFRVWTSAALKLYD